MPFKVGDILVCGCKCGLWMVMAIEPTFAVMHMYSMLVQAESYPELYRLATKWERVKWGV